MLGLYYFWYNRCRVHSTLKSTPAVADGLVTETWTLKRLLQETTKVEREFATLNKKSLMHTMTEDEYEGWAHVMEASEILIAAAENVLRRSDLTPGERCHLHSQLLKKSHDLKTLADQIKNEGYGSTPS